LGDKIKDGKVCAVCDTYGEEDKCIQAFVGQPSGNRPFGRTKHIKVENIRMDLKELNGRMGTGLICLRTGTSSRLL
jgi:hypothetical protein